MGHTAQLSKSCHYKISFIQSITKNQDHVVEQILYKNGFQFFFLQIFLCFLLSPFCNRIILLSYHILSIAVLMTVLNTCSCMGYKPTSNFKPFVESSRGQSLPLFSVVTGRKLIFFFTFLQNIFFCNLLILTLL